MFCIAIIINSNIQWSSICMVHVGYEDFDRKLAKAN